MTSADVRRNMRDLHNAHRKKHGSRSLKLNSDLNAGAQKLANTYGKANYWPSSAHERPGGVSFNRWMNNYYGNRWGLGENLGRGQERSVDVFGPQGAHGGGSGSWTRSTTHHNILRANKYSHLGVAYYKSTRIGRVWVCHLGYK